MNNPGQALEAALLGQHASLMALCAALVEADSVNPPGDTSRVAATVKSWLEERGLETQIVASDEQAINLVSSVEGAAASDGQGRHVVFNAHMDTMEPGDLSAWTVPPFSLSRIDGRAYGLGIGNMKGALAAMCLALATLHERRHTFTGRVTLTAVADEVMFGERGAALLLEMRPDLLGDFLISGEGPGFMALAAAEKGLLWLDLTASGEPGHSSRARAGQTAIMRLASALSAIDAMNEEFADCPEALRGVSGGNGNEGFRLSLNAGRVAAGTVRSQMPATATAHLDIRLPPGISASFVESRVCSMVPRGVEVSRVRAWDANWTDLNDELVLCVAQAARHVRGKEPEFVVRLPGSDARRWRQAGVPAVCYGPQPTLSAGIDDYAFETDIMDCARVYAISALTLMNGS